MNDTSFGNQSPGNQTSSDVKRGWTEGKPRIGELLIASGAVTAEQIEQAMAGSSHLRLGSRLIEMGLVDAREVGRALARQKKVQAAQPEHFELIEDSTVALVNRDVAAQCGAVPLGLYGDESTKRLAVAFRDPDDAQAVALVDEVCGYPIMPVVAPEILLNRALKRYYRVSPDLQLADIASRHTALAFPPGFEPAGGSAVGPLANAQAGAAGISPDKHRHEPQGAMRRSFASTGGYVRGHRSPGLFERLSTGLGFIKQALSLAVEERALVKPSIYLVLSSALYFILVVASILSSDVDLTGGRGMMVSGLATFGSFIIFYLFSGMTVSMIDTHFAGRTPDVGEAFAHARENLGAICSLALISTIVQAIASALRSDEDSSGIVGAFVAAIIETVWTVVTFLMLPAIIIEGISLGDALRRVRTLHGNHLLLIGVGELGVGVVTNVVSFLVLILIAATIYGMLSIFSGTVGLILTFVVGGTMLSLLAAFVTFVRTAYYTCLYLWACEVEAHGDDALAPLPLARVLRSQVRVYRC